MEAPQALELMAACLGAGLPARSACAAVVKCFDGLVAEDLGQVLSLLELGVADVDAWRVWMIITAGSRGSGLGTIRRVRHLDGGGFATSCRRGSRGTAWRSAGASSAVGDGQSAFDT